MIRRDVPLTEQPDRWLLISQVEHARISGQLASAWQGEPRPAVVFAAPLADPHLQNVRDELLAAITHHDDGWAAWEANPTIDREHGRPYSFMELPRDQTLSIWRDSILRGRQIGPLAGWVVAGHFERLLRDSDDAPGPEGEDWLEEIGRWREEWLREWTSLNRPVHTSALADDCLSAIRLFDWLSLWLCCQCPALPDDSQGEAMTLAEGRLESTPVTVEPQATQAQGELRTVKVAPWPFDEPSIAVDALGYAVQARRFAGTAELAKQRSPMRLRWTLLPGA